MAGPPEDNRFYLDRAPLFYPYHFGGLVSTVNSEILNRIDVYAGGFGAEFGADAQAVIDIYSRRGREDRIGGKFNINFIYSEGLLEGADWDPWIVVSCGPAELHRPSADRCYAGYSVPAILGLSGEDQLRFF